MHARAPWYRMVAVLLGLTMVAAACGGDDDTAGKKGGGDKTTTTAATGEAPARTPVKGGELVFGLESDVASLDVGAAAQPSDKVITLGIYDPLTTYVDGKVEPYLAESVETADDTLATWNLTLRKDITFHDGTPLNADAVVKHFDRLKDPATGCPCLQVVSVISSMDMPDGPEGLDVVFHLDTADVAFPDMLAGSSGYIESPTAVAKSGDDFKNQPVGTGPFTLVDYKPGDRVVLQAYPDYWQTDDDGIQLPYLDKITFRPIPDGGQRMSALQNGDIDIFQTAVSNDVASAEEKGFAAQKISGSSSTILLLNNSKAPFDDVRARQALAYAIDKDALNERVYKGVRVPSYSAFALDSPYYKDEVGTPKFDPKKAKALVDELGGLEFSILGIPTPEVDQMFSLLKQMGEQVGMKIKLDSQEQGAFVSRILSRSGDYQAARFRSTHFIEPDAVRSGLTTGNAGNPEFYSNKEVDKLLDEARQTDDFDKRKVMYDKVQEITGKEVPLITLLYDLYGNVYNDETVGPPPPGEANSLGAIKPGFLYRIGG